MRENSDLVSPRQAARAMGVSESSLKRWCDQGLIRMTRTAGGHRKLPIAEVLRYVRDHNRPLLHPDLLGLPAASPGAVIGLGRAVPHSHRSPICRNASAMTSSNRSDSGCPAA